MKWKHRSGLTHSEDIVEAVCDALRSHRPIDSIRVAPEVWHRVRREVIHTRDPGLGFESGRMFWIVAGTKVFIDVNPDLPADGEEFDVPS